MENGQKEAKAEVANDVADEVKDVETPVDTADGSSSELLEEKSTEEPSAELLEKIKEQIEYYFGNVNMQRDKFLIEQTKLDEGWVPMTVMLNFKLLADLSKNIDTILKALEDSDLMEISEDKKKIRRTPKQPIPEYNEEYRKAQEARTVYVKGFPLTDTTINKLKVFFGPYKPFETIVMRKYQDKDKNFKFKGSVFVQFKTLDDAKTFMAVESIKYEDTELIRKWVADYMAEKAQEKEERRQKKPDKSKKSTNMEQKETKGEEANQTSTTMDIKLPKGSVMYFSGVSQTCTREDIKGCLNELNADIAYIDFHRGNTEGWIRLQGENTAKPLIEKMKEGKVVICDREVTCKILEGEEEDKYLAKVTEEMINSKNKYSKKRGNKKGRNAQGGKKRNSSPARDATPAKKKAVD